MWRIIGQAETVSLFQNGLSTGSLAHAYLFIGPRQIGKATLAYDIAMAVNCEQDNPPCGQCRSCQRILNGLHSDIFFIGVNGNSGSNGSEQKSKIEIGIDQIKKLQQHASLPPYEGKYKVFIINDADRMSHEAANCLLKTLEEPPQQMILLLLAADESKILPTIFSRCQLIRFKPLAATKIEDILRDNYSADPDKSKLIARLSGGCLGWALTSLSDDSQLQKRFQLLTDMDSLLASSMDERFSYIAKLEDHRKNADPRKNAESVINLWLLWWHDLLLVKNNCSESITNIDFTAVFEKWARVLDIVDIKIFINCLQNSLSLILKNANIRLTLEVLMLDMPETGK